MSKNKLTKQQIQEGYNERIHDIDSRMFWSVYARECKRTQKKNSLLFDKIREHEGVIFLEDLKAYMFECEAKDYGEQLYKIVDEIPANDLKYFQEEDEYIFNAYVNQTCNGGYSGDDFSGYIYIPLPIMNKYFYFVYSM